MLKELKRIFVLFCILFTFATLLNSALNLIFGFEFSLHLHIFERAALNFINAAILSVVFKLRHKYLFMRFLTQYLTVIILLAGTGI